MSVHHIPPWYPDKGPHHNPWTMNGETGSAAQTHYMDWLDSLYVPGESRDEPSAELARLIAEYRAGVEAEAEVKD